MGTKLTCPHIDDKHHLYLSQLFQRQFNIKISIITIFPRPMHEHLKLGKILQMSTQLVDLYAIVVVLDNIPLCILWRDWYQFSLLFGKI